MALLLFFRKREFMPDADYILRSHHILTCAPSRQQAESGREHQLLDGYIAVRGERIGEVAAGEPQTGREGVPVLDLGDALVTPGFVDPHTHLVHGGSRENELAMKLEGYSYMEIHKIGGIKATMRATRAASFEQLFDKAYASLDRMLLHGTTTVEAKSGYGLDRDTELRLLEVNRALEEKHPITVVSTYLGPHDVPPEFADQDAYVDFVNEQVLPEVARRGLASFADIFTEKDIFEIPASRRYLQRAKDLGFKLKVHADELVSIGGAELAAEMGAVSAEHLMQISDEGIRLMAERGVIADLLPATTFFLMADHFAPARRMLEAGVTVALATDYNPGSSPTENIQEAMWQACFGMKLSPSEIMPMVTYNAARSLCLEKELGSLEAGKYADILVFDIPSPEMIFYRFGVNHLQDVYKHGKQVVKGGALLPRP